MASREKFCCVCGKAGNFENYVCPACGAASSSSSPQQVVHTIPRDTEGKPIVSRTVGCRRCGRLLDKGRWILYSPGMVKSDNFRLITCVDCQKATTGYYEAIIQFSTTSGKFDESKEEIEKLLQNAINSEEKHGKMVEITKIEKNNYFFNNIRAAKRIARKVASAYKARISETSKLVGVDRISSKEKRRVTMLIEL